MLLQHWILNESAVALVRYCKHGKLLRDVQNPSRCREETPEMIYVQHGGRTLILFFQAIQLKVACNGLHIPVFGIPLQQRQ